MPPSPDFLITWIDAPKNQRRLIKWFVILVFAFIPIFLCFSWSMYYSINPLSPFEDKIEKKMEITYPPPSAEEMSAVWLDAKFKVSSVGNKPIAEGNKLLVIDANVTLSPISNESLLFAEGISNVWIGFQHAEGTIGSTIATTDFNGIFGQRAYKGIAGAQFEVPENALLNRTYYKYNPVTHSWRKYINPGDIYLKETLCLQFNFPVSGDYSPCIVIRIWNNTTHQYVYKQYTDGEQKLHVSPISEMRTQLFSQLGLLLTLALFAFSAIELWKLFDEWVKKAPERIDDEYNTRKRNKIIEIIKKLIRKILPK